MPGTDLCIKIGGWVRAEVTEGGNGSLAWGAYNGNFNNRDTNNLTTRARGYITADVRNQTEYGTIRGYISVGLSRMTSVPGATKAATCSAPTARSCNGRA